MMQLAAMCGIQKKKKKKSMNITLFWIMRKNMEVVQQVPAVVEVQQVHGVVDVQHVQAVVEVHG